MEVFKTSVELQEYLQQFSEQNMKIGFVPTMGALHNGHLKLVEKAAEDNQIVVCSIFVNPTQFNNPTDLEKYPRMPEKDISLLKKLNCNVLFIPSVEEIYPEEDKTVFDFGILENVMEGKFRPGHFKGVAMVVKRLFEIVNPDNAYFGLKDYQQYLVIKKLVEDFNLNVNIVGCPTVREKDGLAMSSRNLRLSKEQRKTAPLIFEYLNYIKTHFKEKNIHEWKDWFENKISNNPILELEYVEIADAKTLAPPLHSDTLVVCVAVFAGEVRLIDNILINN